VDFTVLNTSVVNAFAIPGHVYATRGFLVRLQNEAQFAAVMAHEMAHVAAGHTAQNMTHQALVSLGIGLAKAALGDSAGSRGALAVGQASIVLLGLSYSRQQERQADRVGVYYMTLAGWDPRQAISMLRLLGTLNKDKESVLDRYLSTHPPTSERIEELKSFIHQNRLLEKGLVQGDGVYAERWNSHLAALRDVNRAYEPYDKGRKHLEREEYEQALEQAEKAIALRADQAPFHRLRGDALLALGRLHASEAKDYARAEAEFATATRAFPANLDAHYGLGVARYNQGKYEDAIPPLEAVAGVLLEDPTVHYMLAVCYDNTGRTAEAYEAYARAISAGLEGAERRRAMERLRDIQRSTR